MNIKEKAAILSTGLNILLTILKFLCYFFTGSVAILAEAWHSLTDIFTSALVYWSVKRKKEEFPAAQETGLLKHLDKKEHKISFIIGLILLSAAIGLIYKIFKTNVTQITNPLIVGIIFILFSFGSYIVYKFEKSIGENEKSIGLISDGLHSKADMTSTLLAGFVLIIYKLGIDIDRIAGVVIAVFVLSFAVETIANSIIYLFSPDLKNTSYHQYKTSEIIQFIFNSKPVKKVIEFIKIKFKLKHTGNQITKRDIAKYILIITMLLIICWFLTGIYSVKIDEQALIERFGRPLNINEPIKPGLHLKLPWPIDKVVKVPCKRIKSINIGNSVDKNTMALIWTKEHGTEESFLSADNNLFYPYLAIHYKIKNIFLYKYKNKNVEEIIENTAHRVITKIFCQKEFNDIITTYRKDLAIEIENHIQNELDNLQTGIEIVGINIKDMHPPIFIADAFEDVIASLQDKQKIINEAYAYKNEMLPSARAAKYIEIKKAESKTYKKQKSAEGESSRFKMQAAADLKNKKINRKRIYLEKMRQILIFNQKIIIDPKSGTPEIWMNFDKLPER